MEPSAGTGAFYALFPDNRIGYDLDPKYPRVGKADFLTVDLLPLVGQDVIAVGNPPFGKNASLAVKFFNRCATVSRVIGFIVPRTFRKASVINRLDPFYELVHDETLPPFSFIADGAPYDVPCCFQIWERKGFREKIITPTRHNDFDFVKRHEGSFAVQRVGVKAGTVKDISPLIADASHYFIRPHHPDIRPLMEQIDYSSVKHETAGNPSISKGELISLYEGICPSRV